MAVAGLIGMRFAAVVVILVLQTIAMKPPSKRE
jgi:hypothetical protein